MKTKLLLSLLLPLAALANANDNVVADSPAPADGVCQPVVSCGVCEGYKGEYTSQTCTVVDCNGNQSTFSQNCQVQ